jgi:hypothetical protein
MLHRARLFDLSGGVGALTNPRRRWRWSTRPAENRPLLKRLRPGGASTAALVGFASMAHMDHAELGYDGGPRSVSRLRHRLACCSSPHSSEMQQLRLRFLRSGSFSLSRCRHALVETELRSLRMSRKGLGEGSACILFPGKQPCSFSDARAVFPAAARSSLSSNRLITSVMEACWHRHLSRMCTDRCMFLSPLLLLSACRNLAMFASWIEPFPPPRFLQHLLYLP